MSCWNVKTKEVETELNCADVVPITESGSLHAYFTNNLEGKIVIHFYMYWINLWNLILKILKFASKHQDKGENHRPNRRCHKCLCQQLLTYVYSKLHIFYQYCHLFIH